MDSSSAATEASRAASRTGRVAFYDFNTAPAATAIDTTIDTPIEGRVVPAGTPFSIQGTAKAPERRLSRAGRDPGQGSGRWLQDDLTTWGSSNTILTTLGTAANGVRPWSLGLNLTGSRPLLIRAKAFAVGGGSDPVKALKTMETFSFDDQTPTTNITGPGSIQSSTTFTDDGHRERRPRRQRSDVLVPERRCSTCRTTARSHPIFNTFRGLPDVVGATNATWSYEVTLPVRG